MLSKFYLKKKVYKGIANFGYAPTFKRKKISIRVFYFQ